MRKGQAQNSEMVETPPADTSPQYRCLMALAIILEALVAVIQSPPAKTIARRLSLLAEGGWLPGKGDYQTLAALTNKSDRTIEEIVSDNPRPKYRIGKHPYFSFDEFAKPDQRRSTGVAPKK